MSRRVLLSCTFLCIPLFVFAAPKNGKDATQTFCESDPRPEIRVYCEDLDRYQKHVNAAANQTLTKDNFSDDLNHLDPSHATGVDRFITATALSSLQSTVLREVLQNRIDRQLSSPSSSNGTTSLVSTPGSAEILSLALDAGVLTKSVNGTTATLSTNADQVFRLLTGADPDCTVTCTDVNPFEKRVLDPMTILFSVDVAQQSSKTTPTSGQASGSTAVQVSSAQVPTGAGKLSGIVARYEVLNRFDPRSPAFRKKWKEAIDNSKLRGALKNVGDATDKVKDSLQSTATPLDRQKMLDAARQDPSGRALANVFDRYLLDVSGKIQQSVEIDTSILQVMQNRAAYRQAWLDALHQAAGNLLTFEYGYNRPANQPFTHDFKLIYGYDFGNRGLLTFNGAVSLYDRIAVGAKYGRIHYGQVSMQYDRTMSGKDRPIQSQLSLAGYWQYQPSPSILNIPAGSVAPGTNIPLPNGIQEFVGTKGSLWVTQAKLTIKGTGGINVPIGVSWSNKTDLLQGSKVGAQLGISYNFSSLTGLFTGGGQ